MVCGSRDCGAVLFVTGIGRDAWQYSRETGWNFLPTTLWQKRLKLTPVPTMLCFPSGPDRLRVRPAILSRPRKIIGATPS